MTNPAVSSARTVTAALPYEDLVSSPSIRSATTASQFEAMFLQMLIKELRSEGAGDGLFPGDATDTYGGMFDQFIAAHLAESGGLGLAKYINQNVEPVRQ